MISITHSFYHNSFKKSKMNLGTSLDRLGRVDFHDKDYSTFFTESNNISFLQAIKI